MKEQEAIQRKNELASTLVMIEGVSSVGIGPITCSEDADEDWQFVILLEETSTQETFYQLKSFLGDIPYTTLQPGHFYTCDNSNPKPFAAVAVMMMLFIIVSLLWILTDF